MEPIDATANLDAELLAATAVGLTFRKDVQAVLQHPFSSLNQVHQTRTIVSTAEDKQAFYDEVREGGYQGEVMVCDDLDTVTLGDGA